MPCYKVVQLAGAAAPLVRSLFNGPFAAYKCMYVARCTGAEILYPNVRLVYYAAVLIGRITDPARPSVRVCLFPRVLLTGNRTGVAKPKLLCRFSARKAPRVAQYTERAHIALQTAAYYVDTVFSLYNNVCINIHMRNNKRFQPLVGQLTSRVTCT